MRSPCRDGSSLEKKVRGREKVGREKWALPSLGGPSWRSEYVGPDRWGRHQHSAAMGRHTRRRPALCLTESSPDLVDDSN